MDKGFKYWLRWIAVLPISLIAGILVTFPVHWILYRTLSGGESPFITPYPELPERVLQPFFTSIVIVWVASQIAPQNKFNTAIVLATLWIFAAGTVFALVSFGFQPESTQLNLIAGGLPIIMGVIGAVVGVYIVKKKISEVQIKTT
jgi:hypothetical protein